MRFYASGTLYKWSCLAKQQSSIGKLYAVFESLVVHGTDFHSDLEWKQIIVTIFFFSVLVLGVFQKLLDL